MIEDEAGGIALLTETNHEWAEEYQKLLMEYQRLKEDHEIIEIKYQETQKENVKVKRHMELSVEKFGREKNGLIKQKEDLNGQNEKLRKELREKSVRVINSLIYLLHTKKGTIKMATLFGCVARNDSFTLSGGRRYAFTKLHLDGAVRRNCTFTT